MAPPRLRDERLCWLSVRDRLQRLAHRRRMWETLITLGLAPTATREWERQRMTRYAVAVDELVGRLSDEERAVLRAGGPVPDWFLPEVRRGARRRR